MKLKFLLPTFLLVHSFCLLGQENGSDTFSENELKAYAKIHKYTLDHPFDIASSMQKCVKKIAIPEERMSEILQAQFAGNTIKLSKKELQQLEQLKTLMNSDKKAYDSKIAKFVVANKMKISTYQKLKAASRGDQNFQAKLHKLTVKN